MMFSMSTLIMHTARYAATPCDFSRPSDRSWPTLASLSSFRSDFRTLGRASSVADLFSSAIVQYFLCHTNMEYDNVDNVFALVAQRAKDRFAYDSLPRRTPMTLTACGKQT